jgi:hypothetical protein
LIGVGKPAIDSVDQKLRLDKLRDPLFSNLIDGRVELFFQDGDNDVCEKNPFSSFCFE